MAEELKITKIELSDHRIFSFFDSGAIHYNDQHQLVVGNAIIDDLIIRENLKIIRIDDIDVSEYSRILVKNDMTGEIAGRHKDLILEDIGGYSAKLENEVLSIKLGKQNNS